MIRHYVLFKVKDTIPQITIDNAFNQLALLKEQLPGFIRVVWGKCLFKGESNQCNQRYVFSIDFENEVAYNAFLNNPITDKAKSSILQIAEGNVNGIYGFDLCKRDNASPKPDPTQDRGPNPLDKYRAPVPRLVPRGAK